MKRIKNIKINYNLIFLVAFILMAIFGGKLINDYTEKRNKSIESENKSRESKSQSIDTKDKISIKK